MLSNILNVYVLGADHVVVVDVIPGELVQEVVALVAQFFAELCQLKPDDAPEGRGPVRVRMSVNPEARISPP